MSDDEYAEVFTHEYGHFVDDMLGRPSGTEEFRTAMNMDLMQYDPDTAVGMKNFGLMMDDLLNSDAAYDRMVSDILSAFFVNDPAVMQDGDLIVTLSDGRVINAGSVNSSTSTGYTVTFNLNYTGAPAPSVQAVTAGGKATRPATPTRTGYNFAGWYTDAACTTSFAFDTAISQNTVLYANWVVYGTGNAAQQSTLENIRNMNSGEMPTITIDAEDFIPSSIMGTYSNVTVNSYDSAKDSLKDISSLMLFSDVDQEFTGVSQESVDGTNHYRLQQTYNGYDVYGKQLIVTTDANGAVTSLTGNYDPISEIINTNPRSGRQRRDRCLDGGLRGCRRRIDPTLLHRQHRLGQRCPQHS